LGIPGDGFLLTASKLGKGEMGAGLLGTGHTSLGRTDDILGETDKSKRGLAAT